MATTRADLERMLRGLGYLLDVCSNDLDRLLPKVDLLDITGRYGRLLRALRACTDRSNLLSLVTEVAFAHAFESSGLALEHEVGLGDDNAATSVDFRRTTPAGAIHLFELRLLQQPTMVTEFIEKQLAATGRYTVQFDGEHERQEILRVQGAILSKCQDPDGQPINGACQRF